MDTKQMAKQVTVPVFYSESMVADSNSISPSAAKPAKVVESWKARGFPISLFSPNPVTDEQFERVHDHLHVKDTLDCKKDNGFGNRSPSVAASLPYTSGAMLAAATYALVTGRVAAAPCSGFHHAGYFDSEGFCTFNGLMVTARVLLDDWAVKRVGILDFDMHYGNGTDQIIDYLQLRDSVRHFTAGAIFVVPEHAPAFFDRLDAIVESFSDCDVVLYQAGADPHINDPYGGWLTTEQLRERDKRVFNKLKSMHIPVAWNLAGGYQTERDGSIPKVLEIHDNTMLECVAAFCEPEEHV